MSRWHALRGTSTWPSVRRGKVDDLRVAGSFTDFSWWSGRQLYHLWSQLRRALTHDERTGPSALGMPRYFGALISRHRFAVRHWSRRRDIVV